MTKPILIDGGMGRELERIGAPFSQPLWSAQALIEAPQTVVQAHLNFIEAGAQVITTNAYALVPHHLSPSLYHSRGAELTALAAELATKAGAQSAKDVKIAGCVPPVFGSYDAKAFNADDAPAMITPFFTQQAAHVDLWIAETITSYEEACIITDIHARHGQGKPLWLSYTLPDMQYGQPSQALHSGEDLHDIVALTVQNLRPDALLFNCCGLLTASAALFAAAPICKAHGVKVGIYPNAFIEDTPQRSAVITSKIRQDITPDLIANHGLSWVKNGADIIGGCCGIMPPHIQALSRMLDEE